MRRYTILCLLVTLSWKANAQEVVLEKDLSRSVYNKKSGINHARFGYVFADYGFYASKGDSHLQVIPGQSHNFGFGYRRNHRLYGIYSLGYSMFYFYDVFALKQNTGKNFPNNLLHDKEKLLEHNIATEVHQRFAIKKAYNHLGVYVDAGLYGTFAWASMHKMHDRDRDSIFYGSTKDVTVKGLKYIEPFNCGAVLRIGRNRLSLSARWRVTKWIKNEYSKAQPPKISFGLGISFY